MFIKQLLTVIARSTVVLDAASKLKDEAVVKVEQLPQIRKAKMFMYVNFAASMVAITLSIISFVV